MELISEVVEIDDAASREGVSFQSKKEPREGRLEGHALGTSYHRNGNEEERNERSMMPWRSSFWRVPGVCWPPRWRGK
jgi:hypothetical protein